MQPLAWASLVNGAGGLDARLLHSIMRALLQQSLAWRSLSTCDGATAAVALTLLEGARRTSSSHCSCSISCSLLSRDAFLSFCLLVSLSANLSVDFLSLLLSLSLCRLSLRFSRILFLALCASFSEGPSPFYSTLAQSTGLNYDRDSACLHLGRPPRLSTFPQPYQRALQQSPAK